MLEDKKMKGHKVELECVEGQEENNPDWNQCYELANAGPQ